MWGGGSSPLWSIPPISREDLNKKGVRYEPLTAVDEFGSVGGPLAAAT